jgi:arylsulfatase A-like enzyme/Flp pilus assembly protein TadD
MRFSRSVFLLAVLNASLVAGAKTPNVIVITVDTARADRMGFLGSRRGITPNLDVLAHQGIVFERAYSQAPLTPVSHATIFTGTYPQFHSVTDFGHPLPKSLPFLPEILQKSGYRTAAFIGSIILDPRANVAPGFDRGFDFFDAGFRTKRNQKENRYDTIERRGMDVVQHAIAWLKENQGYPFFIWVHLYDPHAPYDPPTPYRQRFHNLYDGEIAYADAALGELFAYLRKHGLYQNALISLMSDHGESLGAHGEQTHGIFLYDETIHVPLLFKLPNEMFAGCRVRARVRLVDFAPTLLNMLHQPLPSTFQGESLLPFIDSLAGPLPAHELSAYAETDYPHRAFGWSELRSWRTGKFLFVLAPDRELYDQSKDPGAQHNLAPASPGVSDTLQFQLDQFHDRTGSHGDVQDVALTSEQVENLSSLGYIASSSTLRSEVSILGTDPKNKIEIANILEEGMAAAEDGRYQEAIPLLRRVLQDSPSVSIAQLQLGITLRRMQRNQEAIPVLRKALELLPDSTSAQYELGLALYNTGAWSESALYFASVAKQRPTWPDPQYSLASVYARIKRVSEAVDLLHTVLELSPRHFRANLLLGRILTLEGKAQQGLPNLRTAVTVEPHSKEAHLFLADAYGQLGMRADADRERHEASLQHDQ